MSLKKLNLHKDSRGMISMSVILLVLAVVAVGGIAYWRISSYNNNEDAEGAPVTNQTNTATLSDDCVRVTGDENICRVGSITDLSQFSSVVTLDIDGAVITAKYDGKGNSEITGGMDSITYNGRQYVNMFGKWYDSTGDASYAAADPVNFSIATTAGITYENLGKVPCGDATCFHYRMSGGILGETVVECWFGDKDYLPRKYVSSGGFTGNMAMDIDYRDVSIAAPEGALPISELSL